MRAMQARAVDAVRECDAAVAREHGDDASGSRSRTATSSSRSWPTRWACTSTQFQRIVVDPCSVSVVRYTPLRPFVAAPQRHRRRPGRARPAARAGAARRAGRRRRDAGGRWLARRRLGPGAARPDRVGSPTCPARSSTTTRPTVSSPGPWASPGSAPSSCRPARAPGSPAWRWRSSRWRCSPSGSTSCSTRCCGDRRRRPPCRRSPRPSWRTTRRWTRRSRRSSGSAR